MGGGGKWEREKGFVHVLSQCAVVEGRQVAAGAWGGDYTQLAGFFLAPFIGSQPIWYGTPHSGQVPSPFNPEDANMCLAPYKCFTKLTLELYFGSV